MAVEGGGRVLNGSLPRFAECISHTKVTKQDKHTVYSNPMMTMDVLLKIKVVANTRQFLPSTESFTHLRKAVNDRNNLNIE